MDKKILLICLIAIVAFSISCVSAADSNEIVMNSSDAVGISEFGGQRRESITARTDGKPYR